MKKRHYYTAWLLLSGLSCSSHQSRMAALFSDPANGLLQVRKNSECSIVMEVLPAITAAQETDSSISGFLKVKLVLSNNEKTNNRAIMQYLNFGIKSSFYTVQGADTLSCLFCERIPGISEQEFVYIVFFRRPFTQYEQTPVLRLVVADTIAGFGISAFNIKINALKKLEAIK